MLRCPCTCYHDAHGPITLVVKTPNVIPSKMLRSKYINSEKNWLGKAILNVGFEGDFNGLEGGGISETIPHPCFISTLQLCFTLCHPKASTIVITFSSLGYFFYCHVLIKSPQWRESST